MGQIPLNKIRSEVFKQRPVLKEIIDEFGQQSLFDYATGSWKWPDKTPNSDLLEIISRQAAEIYSPAIGLQVKKQLEKKPLVSTIDHLGIWGHPIFVNADLIYSLHFNSSDLAISLATESVSLNNVTSWSGSVLLHNKEAELQRYSFFPDRLKTLPVFSARGILAEDLQRFSKSFGQKSVGLLRALNLNTHEPDFSVQACQASYHLWQTVFPSAPKILYLPLESIVAEYLSGMLINSQHLLSSIVATNTGRQLWKKYFGNEHTFMFWAIDQKKRRQPLTSLPDDTGQLLELMRIKRVYPSSPLCFVVLLLSGFTCVGGFTQTTWLTQIKNKLVDLLKALGAKKYQIDGINSISTKSFAESSLASLSINNKSIKPTALDLLFSGQDYYPKYKKLAGQITLGDSLNSALPEIYEVVRRTKSKI